MNPADFLVEPSNFEITAYNQNEDLWIKATGKTAEIVGTKLTALERCGFVVTEITATFDLTGLIQARRAEMDNAAP